MHYPSKEEFVKLAKKANVVPVYREILADQLTPVSAFLKVKNSYSYLLESVEGEEKVARFSFIGIEPSITFKSKGNSIELTRRGKKKRFFTDSPLKEIAKVMKGFKPAPVKGLPRFSGGLVGFIGYDMIRFFEEIPDENVDDLGIADSVLIMADSHVIFDHFTHTAKVVVNAYIDKCKVSSVKCKGIHNKGVKRSNLEVYSNHFFINVDANKRQKKATFLALQELMISDFNEKMNFLIEEGVEIRNTRNLETLKKINRQRIRSLGQVERKSTA